MAYLHLDAVTNRVKAWLSGVLSNVVNMHISGRMRADGGFNVGTDSTDTFFPIEINNTSPSGVNILMQNNSLNAFSASGFRLFNSEAADPHTQCMFFWEKSAAGAATGLGSFHIRRRNNNQSSASTHFLIDSNGHVRLNNGFQTGSLAQGNVGIRTIPDTHLTIATAENLGWNTRSKINSPANSIITLFNNALNNFDRLQFGGTSSSFPSLKRSSAEIHVRLADDSGYADIDANVYKTGGTSGVSGSFTTVDGKTVTVTNGIITNIV
jgi:hypothetical protein